MAATVGDQRQQYVCPFPRSWYPADSPCAHSDEFHVGGNDPAITDADRERLKQAGQTVSTRFKWVVYLALGAGVVYLAIRGTETFIRLRESWYRVQPS